MVTHIMQSTLSVRVYAEEMPPTQSTTLPSTADPVPPIADAIPVDVPPPELPPQLPDPTLPLSDTSGSVVTPPGPTGPSSPTGADATTYTYNETSGVWENEYYIWDPISHKTQPKSIQNYSYNPATNMWETTEWLYDAPSGAYVPNVISDNVPPQTPEQGRTQSTLGLPSLLSDPNATLTNDQKINSLFDRFFNAAISGDISQNAVSGSALLQSNTQIGNVLTGQANNLVNVINLLHSAWGVGTTPNISTFLANVDGDVFGDLVVDPGAIFASQPLGVKDIPSSNTLTVNSVTNGLIENNIAMHAKSGDVGLNSNTKVGDSATGSASGQANVVDLIDSSIGAGDSFLGTINIWGNLNGDILLPPGFLDQVLASQDPSSKQLASSTDSSTYQQTSANSQKISSEIQALARSGATNATNNTSVGNVTTGDANTNVQVFNLTGQEIIGDNALMVFVNVMGSWVGFIVDRPAGDTSALLGGGIDTNKALPYQTGSGDTTINDVQNNEIRNNVLVSSTSGDINADSNTSLGNLSTGKASSTVNMFDLIGTRMLLSKWFGVLFINVFGSWQGSFGVDTANGNAQPPTPGGGTTGGSGQSGASTAQPSVFVFRASSNGSGGDFVQLSQKKSTIVLASAKRAISPSPSSKKSSTENESTNVNLEILLSICIVLLLYWLLRRRRAA